MDPRDALPLELQAARLRLVKDRPYLASAAWALQPVARPGLGTLAVDMWWRLYYDPAVTTRWTVEELAGVLYHEIAHLLRDHAGRMQGLEPRLSNIAADAEINDDLLREGVRLPGEPVTPAAIGQPDGLLAEEYYAAIQAQQPAPHLGASSAQPEPSGADQSQAGTDPQGDGSGQDPDSAQDTASAPGSGGTDDAQPADRGDASRSETGDSDGSKPGDGEDGESGGNANGSHASSSSDQLSDSSAQPGTSFQPPASPGSGRGSGPDGRESGDGAQTPAPGAGRCGSCATGRTEPWEDGPPGENTSSGITRAEAELIRRDVARQIAEASQSRGDVPGHWRRWADEKLRPKVDWRRELAAAVRHAVADVAGASDYSYRRPSRRQGQVGNGKVVLPSLRRPIPSVAIVVDTSGSLSDSMLAQALAEVSGILKGLGQRESIHVLAVDSTVQFCRRVFRPGQVQLVGGGGTDMRIGIDAAIKLQRPRPSVIIVITDGYTPWPSEAPQKAKVIVALVGNGDAPTWAKVIKVEGENL